VSGLRSEAVVGCTGLVKHSEVAPYPSHCPAATVGGDRWRVAGSAYPGGTARVSLASSFLACHTPIDTRSTLRSPIPHDLLAMAADDAKRAIELVKKLVKADGKPVGARTLPQRFVPAQATWGLASCGHCNRHDWSVLLVWVWSLQACLAAPPRRRSSLRPLLAAWPTHAPRCLCRELQQCTGLCFTFVKKVSRMHSVSPYSQNDCPAEEQQRRR
jgi:hypothetical protein